MAPKETLETVDSHEDLAATFWNSCERGELLIQYCRNCEQWQFYPRFLCSHCASLDVVWRAASGTGTLETFSVVRRAAGEFEAMTPYTVALVRLTEGPTMMSNVVDCAETDLAIGMPLQVRFEHRNEIRVPVFEPVLDPRQR
ncbi:hypothetical protein EV641_10667 [Rhodococcus sp. SMB37]|uniref:Zn-ribbon domain-containing OB-fold protein n=1 Tax=Rhodococcus sp. SMB37 TaxID=2512213 RepID=UPI001053378D|nr:Zn-ribbon domain-containing OB-fold protein [Rhodococcus sp. SMB37]TCN53423.1 hypothetical protein EV641_10667 [Rhodococcus sp. SMB37]